VGQPQIKFGTDGWRGVIADDFTFANLRIVAQAVADYLNSKASEPLAVIEAPTVRVPSPLRATAAATVVTSGSSALSRASRTARISALVVSRSPRLASARRRRSRMASGG